MDRPNEERYAKLLEGCESEKLHLSGAVQPFGALVAVCKKSKKVIFASENTFDFFGFYPTDVLGAKADSFGLWDIFQKLDCSKIGLISSFAEDANGQRYDVSLYGADGYFIIEKEFSLGLSVDALRNISLQPSLLKAPDDEAGLESYNRLLVDSIREIIGFGRVMLYRFADDWSGEVIAESIDPDLGSYLGLKFPASDIPAIARNLYMLNPFRLIADTTAQNIPVLSLDGEIIDLTYSNLRSISPTHIEYLTNMGVKASFSIAVMSLKKLWGLVACHNPKPKYLSYETRKIAFDKVKNYSLGLSQYLTNSKLKAIDGMDRMLAKVLESSALGDDKTADAARLSEALMGVFGADGFAVLDDEVTFVAGDTPAPQIIEKLYDYATEIVFLSDNLPSFGFGFGVELGHTAGAIGFRISSKLSRIRGIFFFRAEEPYEVRWAGNPDKPIAEDPNAIALSPRKSFEKWSEIKRGYSKPWSGADKMTAIKLRNILQIKLNER